MKATEAKLLDFLRKSPQFVIPIYQRTYSWTEKECRQLWEDILRCGGTDKIAVHFVGSIVYVQSGLSQVTHQAPLLVIDGQQRLTTVSLLLAALSEVIGEEERFEGFSRRKIRNYFLLNPEESGDRYYKLILSQTDKTTLCAIYDGKEVLGERSLRVSENFENFKKWIQDSDIETICRGLAKLVIVDIALTRDQDNPQLIFESMNSTGKELSQADLIRNFVLMGLEPNLQTRLYQEYWRPMELEFGQEAYGTHFDAFIRYFLTFKTGDIPNLNAVYDAFKKFAHAEYGANDGNHEQTENLVKEVREFSRYFCAMALGREEDPRLRAAFEDLRELKVDVAYPLLLELYHDYHVGLLARDEFEKAIRMVESYVFRRAICSIPTNSLNKTFANFSKVLRKDRYLESMGAIFLSFPSYRRFPKDEEFLREIQTRDLYNFRSRTYWLRRFENHGRKEHVPVGEYTIEHILPQNENLSSKWREDLGPEWQSVQERYLHRLGNLTLTGYNSEYSDRPFAQKRDMEGGFKDSPLKLNKGLGSVNVWNEEAILERGQRLAQRAVEVWSAPVVDREIIEEYRPSRPSSVEYTLDDHSHFQNPYILHLFDELRKQILTLDPCVSEEILKLYIAYKAETNFVDVVPQAKRLRLSLNMRFPDLYDPKGLARDVTSMGRWGNGDVEVPLSSLEEIPYVMSLVRQSLELQLGNGET